MPVSAHKGRSCLDQVVEQIQRLQYTVYSIQYTIYREIHYVVYNLQYTLYIEIAATYTVALLHQTYNQN